MARFRYSMQSILNIKLKMETQAKQEFSSARRALDEEEEKLETLNGRKAGYEERAQRLLSGPLRLRDIEENRTAILCMENFITQQTLCVKKAQEHLEEARRGLTEVMAERKTHETLRDKEFEQFLMEEKKQESKEVDELTSYTYGQRRSEQAKSGVPVG